MCFEIVEDGLGMLREDPGELPDAFILAMGEHAVGVPHFKQLPEAKLEQRQGIGVGLGGGDAQPSRRFQRMSSTEMTFTPSSITGRAMAGMRRAVAIMLGRRPSCQVCSRGATPRLTWR